MINQKAKEILSDLKIALYADSGSLDELNEWLGWGIFSGITTNPSLLRKAGQQNYQAFAESLIEQYPELPISISILSDTPKDMAREARLITSWSSNISVKIPVVTTKGEALTELIADLLQDGLKLNVTCLMHQQQIKQVVEILPKDANVYLSIFAGRIADTGLDPARQIEYAKTLSAEFPDVKVLWASSREVYNVYNAQFAGADVITVGKNVADKLPLLGMDLYEFCKRTVNMFHQDATSAEYRVYE
jgi:transaldolase